MSKQCPVCRRPLKNRKSIALGIGPVCKRKADEMTLEQLRAAGLDGEVVKEGVQIKMPLQLPLHISGGKEQVKIHELKTWPEFFGLVDERQKNFEVRKNDREFQVGDTLVLREFDPIVGKFTGRSCMREITYILDKPDFVKEGHVILSIK